MSFPENHSVLRPDGARLLLWRAGAAAPVEVDKETALPAATVFSIPGDRVRLLELSVAQEEVRHLDQSLPFMVEDALADPVEVLHFARTPLGEDSWLVAVVRREELSALAQLLPPDWEGPWVPEVLLLPWQEDEVCLVVEAATVVVRYGAWAGTRIETSMVDTLLESLIAPEKGVVVYGSDEGGDLALLPEAWRARAQWRQGGFGTALLVSEGHVTDLDLRQGEFAPVLPLARWWQQWRPVAAAVGIALALQFGADLLQYQQLKSENLALRSAIQASYRQANPRGAVVDVEKQLDRQIAEFRPAAGGVAFTPMLATVSEALNASQDISLTTMNFSASNGEVRLDLVATNYAAIEGLRTRLSSLGLNAILETSSSRDARVRARLRVESRA